MARYKILFNCPQKSLLLSKMAFIGCHAIRLPWLANILSDNVLICTEFPGFGQRKRFLVRPIILFSNYLIDLHHSQ